MLCKQIRFVWILHQNFSAGCRGETGVLPFQSHLLHVDAELLILRSTALTGFCQACALAAVRAKGLIFLAYWGKTWERCCEATSMGWLCPLLLFALPDFPTGTIAWSLFGLLAVNCAEPCWIWKISLLTLIFTRTLLNCCMLFSCFPEVWVGFFFIKKKKICKLSFVCWQTSGDKQRGLLSCSAQARQLCQTYTPGQKMENIYRQWNPVWKDIPETLSVFKLG